MADHNSQIEDKVLSVQWIADYFGVSKPTVRIWMHTGRLSHIRIGRQLRTRQSDLDAFLRECTEQQKAA